jgi:hypothetical protein
MVTLKPGVEAAQDYFSEANRDSISESLMYNIFAVPPRCDAPEKWQV